MRLILKVVSGANAGVVAATRNITIMPPTDALMVKNSGLSHTQTFWGVGFKGDIFLRPVDVSFSRIRFAEGSVAAVATGFLAGSNGIIHMPTATPVPVGGGDSIKGCQVLGQDSVSTGSMPPPFSRGDFLWAIPWQYQIGAIPLTPFTVANHHETADAVGTATIAKKGAGPFTRVPSDPTTSA